MPRYVGSLKKVDWMNRSEVLQVARCLGGTVVKHDDRPNYNIYPTRAQAEASGGQIYE